MEIMSQRDRIGRFLERYVVNSGMVLILRWGVAPSTFALIETIGRRTGKRRWTPVGNGLDGRTFWLVSEHGENSDYVRNLIANPRVRVRVRRRWYSGMASLLPDDEPWQRRERIDREHGWMGRIDGKTFRAKATTPCTIRIDLDR